MNYDQKLDPPSDEFWDSCYDEASNMPLHQREDFLLEKGIDIAGLSTDDVIEKVAEHLYWQEEDDFDQAYESSVGK